MMCLVFSNNNNIVESCFQGLALLVEKKKEVRSLGKHHVLTVILSCITVITRMFYFCLQMISSGVRLDSQLQECQKPHWKKSFTDLDYALFG